MVVATWKALAYPSMTETMMLPASLQSAFPA